MHHTEMPPDHPAQPSAAQLRANIALARLAFADHGHARRKELGLDAPASPLVPRQRGSAFVDTALVVGVFAFAIMAVAVGVGGMLKPAPAPLDIREVTRTLDAQVGRAKPWSRAELEDLSVTVDNLLSEIEVEP